MQEKEINNPPPSDTNQPQEVGMSQQKKKISPLLLSSIIGGIMLIVVTAGVDIWLAMQQNGQHMGAGQDNSKHSIKVDLKNYVDKDKHFQMLLPTGWIFTDKGHSQAPNGDYGMTIETMTDPNGDGDDILVSNEHELPKNYPHPLTDAEFVTGSKEEALFPYDESVATNMVEKDITVDGHRARQVSYDLANSGGTPFHIVSVFVFMDGYHYYKLAFTALKKDTEFINKIDQMIQSFEVI